MKQKNEKTIYQEMQPAFRMTPQQMRAVEKKIKERTQTDRALFTGFPEAKPLRFGRLLPLVTCLALVFGGVIAATVALSNLDPTNINDSSIPIIEQTGTFVSVTDTTETDPLYTTAVDVEGGTQTGRNAVQTTTSTTTQTTAASAVNTDAQTSLTRTGGTIPTGTTVTAAGASAHAAQSSTTPRSITTSSAAVSHTATTRTTAHSTTTATRTTTTPRTTSTTVTTTVTTVTTTTTTTTRTTTITTTATTTETTTTTRPVFMLPDEVRLSMESKSAAPGETVEVDLVFDNTVTIAGVQGGINMIVPANAPHPRVTFDVHDIESIIGEKPTMNERLNDPEDLYLYYVYAIPRNSIIPAGTVFIRLYVEIPETAQRGTVYSFATNEDFGNLAVFDVESSSNSPTCPIVFNGGHITVT